MILESHPVASIFPLMEGDDYEALKVDIAEHGLREAIWLHPDGRIIDGRNRYRVCCEIGLVPEFRTWDGNGSLVAFVISLNLYRRHLNSSQKALVGANILPILEEEAEERQRAAGAAGAAGAAYGVLGAEFGVLGGRGNVRDEKNPPLGKKLPKGGVKDNDKNKAAAQAAAIVGTNRQYVIDAKVIQRESPDLIEQVKRGKLTIPKAKKENARRKDEREVKDRVTTIDTPWLLIGDFREVAATIPNDSVDLIFTDPPYDEAAAALYGDLAQLAARVLKPGGILLTYSGQMHLPQIYTMMVEHLQYMWTCAIGHSGGATKFRKWNLENQWKPVLMFGKPPVSAWWKDSFADFVSGGREKESHPWQQSLAEAQHYIRAVCPPGGVVLDPFLGSGTTCVAAKGLGMQYIGIEKNEVTASKAKQRVEDHSI